MSRVLPPELGDLAEIHRPMRGHTGWIPVLALPVALGLVFGLGPPGPLIGLLIFLGLFFSLGLAMAEYFLVEHRIYRHGIVFGHQFPGFARCVVPYYTCDPKSLATIGRTVHDHTGQALSISRRFRVTGFTRTNILMTGLEPSVAKHIGSGKAGWDAGTDHSGIRIDADGSVIVVDDDDPQAHRETWVFSSRTPEHHITLLRDLISADRAKRSGTTG